MKIRVDANTLEKAIQIEGYYYQTPENGEAFDSIIKALSALNTTPEQRFQFLSENYPEHRSNLNYYFWHNRGIYEIVVNHLYEKYNGITRG